MVKFTRLLMNCSFITFPNSSSFEVTYVFPLLSPLRLRIVKMCFWGMKYKKMGLILFPFIKLGDHRNWTLADKISNIHTNI